jgi:hypothetical protein
VSYITADAAHNAIQNLKSFHSGLCKLFKAHGMSLETNSGRRNVILSQAQEEFFAREISKSYSGVIADGKTGMPDIVIGELGIELECKLTSPRKDGNINLQADEFSLTDETPKDFLYLITRDMEEFAVLHFVGLVKSDFQVSGSPRSKGKMRLDKSKAMRKCKVLVGNVENRTTKMLESAESQLENTSPRAKRAREKLQERIEFWKNSGDTYSVNLVAL